MLVVSLSWRPGRETRSPGKAAGILMTRGLSSPRGWLSWAASMTSSYHRPFAPRLEYLGMTDHRLNDARETAISIIRLCEKSANGDGGAGLLYEFFVEDKSWYSFTEAEQRIINRTARAFRCSLCGERFLEACGRKRRSCKRGKG